MQDRTPRYLTTATALAYEDHKRVSHPLQVMDSGFDVGDFLLSQLTDISSRCRLVQPKIHQTSDLLESETEFFCPPNELQNHDGLVTVLPVSRCSP